MHILNVEEHHSLMRGNKEPVAEALLHVKGRLSYHLSTVKHLLTGFFPKVPLPSAPGPQNSSADHAYAKKEYGWLVIVRLRDWAEHVLQLLEEMKNTCDQHRGQRPLHTV